MKNFKNKQNITGLLLLSVLIEIGLLWIVYGKTPHDPSHPLIPYLPIFSASFNLLSAFFLFVAKKMAERKKITTHIKCICTALAFSAFFLISYLTYHWLVGRVYFPLEGVQKVFFLSLLLTHILASIINLPMILITIYFALTGQFALHKKIAPKTFYLWQFVSLSGVIIIIFPKLL